MKNYKKLLQSSFSHIYVEDGAQDFELTAKILDKFTSAKVISIVNYKSVFARNRQNFNLQKESPKLILAVKKDDFLYPGSNMVPTFGEKNFFYNSLMLNCLYDCQYCYLQGMYPSANMVIFVNLEDFFKKTDEVISELKKIYLCISYDTDLLAFENIVPYCSAWLEYARKNPAITIELRTKSSNFNALKRLTPCDNFILAWTLSPQDVVEKFENKTPNFEARLSSIAMAIEHGWQVRLCFDPVLRFDNWGSIYENFLDQVVSGIDLSKVRDISIGTFRINNDYFKKMSKVKPSSDIMSYAYTRNNGLISYSDAENKEIYSLFAAKLAGNFDKSRIYYM